MKTSILILLFSTVTFVSNVFSQIKISNFEDVKAQIIALEKAASKDSYFSRGFFHSIFQRTEYMEAYVMEPMAKKMLAESQALQTEFEKKKAEDKSFAIDANAILTWFYSKTKYYDERYLLYPVARVLWIHHTTSRENFVG